MPPNIHTLVKLTKRYKIYFIPWAPQAKNNLVGFHGCVFRRDRAPSRIPVKKLQRLSQKAQKMRVFWWKSIRTNTPLSPKFIIILDALIVTKPDGLVIFNRV